MTLTAADIDAIAEKVADKLMERQARLHDSRWAAQDLNNLKRQRTAQMRAETKQRRVSHARLQAG